MSTTSTSCESGDVICTVCQSAPHMFDCPVKIQQLDAEIVRLRELIGTLYVMRGANVTALRWGIRQAFFASRGTCKDCDGTGVLAGPEPCERCQRAPDDLPAHLDEPASSPVTEADPVEQARAALIGRGARLCAEEAVAETERRLGSVLRPADHAVWVDVLASALVDRLASSPVCETCESGTMIPGDTPVTRRPEWRVVCTDEDGSTDGWSRILNDVGTAANERDRIAAMWPKRTFAIECRVVAESAWLRSGS